MAPVVPVLVLVLVPAWGRELVGVTGLNTGVCFSWQPYPPFTVPRRTLGGA